MAEKKREKQVARQILKTQGMTFAEEAGIRVKNSPASLYQLLCASLLFSARIRSGIAVRAVKSLKRKGWTSPEKMAASTWKERTKALNQSGYARYDESTATMLGETTEMILKRYGGDLRKLRKEAKRDPAKERELLKQFKGIGDIGVDIFFREVQGAWKELYPFADLRALRGAKKAGLPADKRKLSEAVSRSRFPKLVAALVRLKPERQHGK